MLRIIVPTDFSDCSEYALEVAAQLAKKSGGSELHLVHFYDRPISGYTLQFQIDNKALRELKDAIEEKMDKLAAKPYLDDVDVHTHYIPDRDIMELPELDFVQKADLIVMGSSGDGEVLHPFIGSKTQRIVRMTTTPVLVVKNRCEEFEMINVVFASSFHQEVDAAFRKIKKLTDIFDSRVHLLKVITPGQFETTRETHELMDGFANAVGLEEYTKRVINDDTIEDGVNHYANSIKADLIAIETHGKVGLARIVNGSVVDEVIDEVRIPVLSVRMEPIETAITAALKE